MQIYEGAFSYLQMHPCYVINLLLRTEVAKDLKLVRKVVYAIFGAKQIRDNSRILSKLLVVADKVLAYQLQRDQLTQIISSTKLSSTFYEVWQILFTN